MIALLVTGECERTSDDSATGGKKFIQQKYKIKNNQSDSSPPFTQSIIVTALHLVPHRPLLLSSIALLSSPFPPLSLSPPHTHPICRLSIVA